MVGTSSFKLLLSLELKTKMDSFALNDDLLLVVARVVDAQCDQIDPILVRSAQSFWTSFMHLTLLCRIAMVNRHWSRKIFLAVDNMTLHLNEQEIDKILPFLPLCKSLQRFNFFLDAGDGDSSVPAAIAKLTQIMPMLKEGQVNCSIRSYFTTDGCYVLRHLANDLPLFQQILSSFGRDMAHLTITDTRAFDQAAFDSLVTANVAGPRLKTFHAHVLREDEGALSFAPLIRVCPSLENMIFSDECKGTRASIVPLPSKLLFPGVQKRICVSW